jgi:hypothetical protein
MMRAAGMAGDCSIEAVYDSGSPSLCQSASFTAVFDTMFPSKTTSVWTRTRNPTFEASYDLLFTTKACRAGPREFPMGRPWEETNELPRCLTGNSARSGKSHIIGLSRVTGG